MTIVGLVSTDNAFSIRGLEKLGLKFEKMVHMSESDPDRALYA